MDSFSRDSLCIVPQRDNGSQDFVVDDTIQTLSKVHNETSAPDSFKFIVISIERTVF